MQRRLFGSRPDGAAGLAVHLQGARRGQLFRGAVGDQGAFSWGIFPALGTRNVTAGMDALSRTSTADLQERRDELLGQTEFRLKCPFAVLDLAESQ